MTMYALTAICLAWSFAVNAAAQNSTVLELSSLSWTLTSPNVSVPGTVPSQAHLDLLAAGIIDDPLYGENDFQYAWVAYSNFTYTSGAISGLSNNANLSTWLVFEGLDTIADVYFCNQHIASTNNQFRRWEFDVSSALNNCSSSPVIKVAFKSAPVVSAQLERDAYNAQHAGCVECYGLQFQFPGRQFVRKEQNDDGWDWSPGLAPQGIWKPGRIVQIPRGPGKVEVEGIFVDVYRAGQINNLVPDQGKPFVLNASVDFIGELPNETYMYANLVDASGKTFWQGFLDNGGQTNQSITGSITLPKEPDLWWPNGYGQQTMYNLTITLIPSTSKTTRLASVQTRTGFRTLVLNQSPVTAQQVAQGINQGDNWHFEINGNEIFAKGSNFVPPDPFWPRITREDVEILFSSAVAAHMNMLRVWSSSIYMPDFVYDLADEYGLMLWSELQFSDAFYPHDTAFEDNIVQEASENVRRINRHPSIALWAGGNELELSLLLTAIFDGGLLPAAKAVYEFTFLNKLLHAVFDNTRSISYIPGSTTLGYTSFDYNRSYPIAERPQPNSNVGPTYGDADFYNYDVTIAFKQSTYNPSSNGPLNSRFVNEFGFHSHSSYETYEAYIPPSELSFNSSVMIHRNRHFSANDASDLAVGTGAGGPNVNRTLSLGGLGQMSYGSELYYPTPHKNDSAGQFKAQIYATQIFQAEMIRFEIDLYRRASGLPQRILGSLYWMLNDIWAAPTWASLETGGRWKLLHHIAKDVYSPVIIHPFVSDDQEFSVYVTSDLWQPVQSYTSLTWYDWSGTNLNVSSDWAFANESVIFGAIDSAKIFSNQLIHLPQILKTAVAVLRSDAIDANGTSYTAERFYTPQYLSNSSSIRAFRDPQLNLTYDAAQDEFVVESKAIAAYVWLSQPLAAKGYFSDNGFWMLPGRRVVKFVPFAARPQPPSGWQRNVSVISVWDLTTR